MAERLATDIERWTGLSVHCRHLDLGKAIEKQKRAKERRKAAGAHPEGVAESGWVVTRRRVVETFAPRNRDFSAAATAGYHGMGVGCA